MNIEEFPEKKLLSPKVREIWAEIPPDLVFFGFVIFLSMGSRKIWAEVPPYFSHFWAME